MVKPSIDELKNQFLTRFYANAPNTESKNSVSIETILAYAVAGLIYLLWGLIDGYYKELFIQTSTGERLDYWASIVSLTRRQATKSTGQVTFTGANNALIPLGTQLQTSTGVVFTTDVEAKITGGKVAVNVTASTIGALGNTAKTDNLVLMVSLSGIDKTVTITSDGLGGGSDIETDGSYRSRIIDAFKIRSVGGNKDDYIKWVKSISGVDKVFLMNQYGLSNGIAVMVLSDNDEPMASQVLLDKVQDHLDQDDVKPFTDEVYVLNSSKNQFTKNQMSSVPVNFEIHIDKKVDAQMSVIQAAIETKIKDYLRTNAEPFVDLSDVNYTGTPSKTYHLTAIGNLILTTDGVENYQITLPKADFTPITLGGKRFDVVKFGGITWK